MSKVRSDDKGEATYFRSNDRVTWDKDGWYYLLRGAEPLGPFSNKIAAEFSGSDFISNLQKEESADQKESSPKTEKAQVRLKLAKSDTIKRHSGSKKTNAKPAIGALAHIESAELSYPHGYQWAASGLVANARAFIRIYSASLDPDVYSDIDLARNLFTMLKSHKGASVRVMVLPEADLSSKHYLIELAKKLPSFCQLRVLNSQPRRFQEDYILADRRGLLVRKPEEDLASLDTRAEKSVAERIEHFDSLWAGAEDSAELRDQAMQL
ncbi:MAG: DUF6316 family protein [Pseudomonadales bacterium]